MAGGDRRVVAFVSAGEILAKLKPSPCLHALVVFCKEVLLQVQLEAALKLIPRAERKRYIVMCCVCVLHPGIQLLPCQ